jgi:hypothetical protein
MIRKFYKNINGLHHIKFMRDTIIYGICHYIDIGGIYIDIELIYLFSKYFIVLSQWPRGLRHELSSLARTLRSWAQIPLEAWMSVCVYSVFVLFYEQASHSVKHEKEMLRRRLSKQMCEYRTNVTLCGTIET